MYGYRKVILVIVAAGAGSRMGLSTPKQFLPLNGDDRTPMLKLTVDRAKDSQYVDEIIVVTGAEHIALAKEILQDREIHLTTGGKRRQDSVMHGITKAKSLLSREEFQKGIVLIHDGARPYAKGSLFDDVVMMASDEGAAVPVIEVKDTIRDIQNGGLDRSRLRCVQTPQGFRLPLIEKAMNKAYKEDFMATDEGGLMDYINYPVAMVKGSVDNIKITYLGDLSENRNLEKDKKQMGEDWATGLRIGTGYDVHKLIEGPKLILGGVHIPYEKGLLGHSDADVLTHALMDGILGAMKDGDIGRHFSDNDERYAGISSIKLLELVLDRMNKNGYQFINADVTVICQNPKINQYVPDMEKILEEKTRAKGRINIKGTTTERLGFEGRGEGIAAMANVLLYKRY